MKTFRIENTGQRGWFIGSFPGAAFVSDQVEVCYTVEQVGKPLSHYHTKCTETIFVVRGKMLHQGKQYTKGDIIVLEPGEINDCEYLEETEVVAVKIPAGGDDKILI